MPKQSPIPDEVSQPFWDGCNDGKLMVQKCLGCSDRRGLTVMQHPPDSSCRNCGSDKELVWQQASGVGTIQTYCVMYDTPISSLQVDQPFNMAVIELAEDRSVLFLSHLPGTPVDEVPIGATVQVEFEATNGTGQRVPEWRVVG